MEIFDNLFLDRVIDGVAVKLLTAVNKMADNKQKMEPRLTKIISRNRVKIELEISDKTLDKWEANGLKRYQPDYDDTRKAYYKVDELLAYIGIESD